MRNNVSNLTVHKTKKKLEYMRGDIETAVNILKIVKAGLGEFTIYVPVRDVLINITQNQKLLEDHLNKKYHSNQIHSLLHRLTLLLDVFV